MNSPAEAIKLVSHAGIKKGNMRPDKVFLSAVSAGCLLNFGSAVMLIAITSPWYEENAPGLLKIIGALVFPFGFAAVIVTGVDLFTATTMVSKSGIYITVMLQQLTYISVYRRACPSTPLANLENVPPLASLLLRKSCGLPLHYDNYIWM